MRSCGGFLESLQILKFLPAGLALFNGKANPSGNVVPVGAEVKICLQLNETAVSVADPKHPNAAWEFSGGAGSRRFLGCGRCGVGEGEVVSRDADGLRGAGVCWCAGAESQEDVGEGKGMVKEGGAGRGGKERWKWLSTCPVWSR